MKKIVLLLAAFILAPYIYAQNVRLPEKPKPQRFKDFSVEQSGVWYAAEISAASSIILNHDNVQRSFLTFTVGYRLNEFLRGGVGLGVNCYFNGNEKVRGTVNKWTMPVFLNLRGNIVSQDARGVVPYWSLDGGALLGDGYFISPTIGIRIGQHRNSFLIGLNYAIGDIDTSKGEIYSNPVNFLGLKLGYEF